VPGLRSQAGHGNFRLHTHPLGARGGGAGLALDRQLPVSGPIAPSRRRRRADGAVSRARDEAAEARRGGLSAWRSNPAVYHDQRRLQDPTLPAAAAVAWRTAGPGFPAALMAAFLPGRGRVGKTWRCSATLIAVAATILLLAAGSIVKPP
jgi:hypothetical protein